MATAAQKKLQSCTTCPQYLDPSKQLEALGKSFGGPVCLLKQLAIGVPSGTGKNSTQKFASRQGKTCDSFGTPVVGFKPEARTQAIELPVAMPNMTVITADPVAPELVSSCLDCQHFRPSGIMRQKTGWSAGYCDAKGVLLLEDRLSKYADGCSFRSHTTKPLNAFDPKVISQVQINFLPEYTDAFGQVDLLGSLTKSTVEPEDYPTDKPVGAKAQELGVRAWRRITDPKGYGPDVYLPVFDINKFPENERAAIPRTGDDEHPEWYLDHGGFVYKVAVLWTRLDETPALWGPAGVGKTELFRHLGWLMCSPFERISITGSTELDDIAGKMMYTPEQGTYYHYGRIPVAWNKPNVLCVDEPNVGPPDVWQFIRPLTDDSKQLVLDQNKGERIPRHVACYLGFAMNPAWDPRNVGAMPLGDADGSRLMHIYMNLPPKDIELAIIKRRCLADRWDENQVTDVAKTLMKIAPEIRKLSEDGVVSVSWGIRQQIKVARAKRYLSWRDAYLLGVADALEPQARQAILDIVGNHVDDDEEVEDNF